MLYKTYFYQEWITKNKIKYTKKLIAIINFFMIETLSELESSRGVSFEDLGWNNNKDIKEDLMNYLREIAGLKKDKNYSIITNKSTLQKNNNKSEFYKNINSNYVEFIKDTNEFDSMIFYLRCALAHGRFAIYAYKNEKVYVLENVKQYNGQVYIKARFVLREKNLLDWIKIIKSGQKKFIENKKKIKFKYAKEITRIIKKNNITNIETIKEVLISNLIGNYYKEVWDEMRKNNVVYYDRHLKKWEYDKLKFKSINH